MGWTSYHRPKGQSDRDHLQSQMSEPYKIVDSATVKGTFYAAVLHKDTGDVYGLVVLQRRIPNDHYNYSTKWIGEESGPVEDLCPAHILDQLSPTDIAWAKEWRARCRANATAKATRPKVKKGDLVKFTPALRFTSGTEADTLEFVERSTFRLPGSYASRFHVTSWRDRQYEVIS